MQAVDDHGEGDAAALAVRVALHRAQAIVHQLRQRKGEGRLALQQPGSAAAAAPCCEVECTVCGLRMSRFPCAAGCCGHCESQRKCCACSSAACPIARMQCEIHVATPSRQLHVEPETQVAHLSREILVVASHRQRLWVRRELDALLHTCGRSWRVLSESEDKMPSTYGRYRAAATVARGHP